MALYTLKELLADAQARRYGVGFFDTHNQEMLVACIEAAEERRSPIAVGTAESLLKYADFDTIVPMMLEAARRAKVPVAVHMDHSDNFDCIMRALRCGFGSVMYDGSRATYEENVRMSAEVVRAAHPMGVAVECELGHVGGASDGDTREDENVYTDPDMAASFVELTGADFLAVSIGTVHGVYKSEPRLDLDRLAEIRKRVDVPLVLHGGSGLSDDDFRNVIAGGITKVNIYTDVILAGKKAIADNMDKGYGEMLQASKAAMRQTVMEKLDIFGSTGKA